METSTAIKLINHPQLHAGKIATWADLGCGDGFFTNALSSLLPRESTIYAADNNAGALKRVAVTPSIHLKTNRLDFVKNDLPFGKLDGILMANSLHYVKDKATFLTKLKSHLHAEGQLLIVEYDTTKANPWVPYPITFNSLLSLCQGNGFASVTKLGETPSAFRQGNMYAALASLHS